MSAPAALESMTYTHDSVLLKETAELLVTDPGGAYLDATVGLGGHSEALLRSISAQGSLLGTDMDQEALTIAAQRLEPYAGKFRLVHANFRNLSQILSEGRAGPWLAGALFDLGVSSLQLDKPSRGFALMHEGPLDMRLDQGASLTAARIVNEWPVEQLELLLREYGEERESGKIARLIVSARKVRPIWTTRELKELIESKMQRSGRIHPATRTFMALRIAVNQELENLTRGLEGVMPWIRSGGRLAVISFHSLEDRIAKNVLKSFIDQGQWRWITQSPVTPGAGESERNPRSRSAKLRVAEKR